MRPLHGADRLARLYLQVARNLGGSGTRYVPATLNGAPALLLRDGEALLAAIWIECDGDRITAIHALRHPRKLTRLLAVTKPAAAASLY